MAAVSDPGFAAVEEGSDADGLIDRDLCAEIEVFVLEDPTSESPKSSRCLLDPVLDLIMQFSSDRKLPRYLKDGTMASGSPETVKVGGVDGLLELH